MRWSTSAAHQFSTHTEWLLDCSLQAWIVSKSFILLFDAPMRSWGTDVTMVTSCLFSKTKTLFLSVRNRTGAGSCFSGSDELNTMWLSSSQKTIAHLRNHSNHMLIKSEENRYFQGVISSWKCDGQYIRSGLKRGFRLFQHHGQRRWTQRPGTDELIKLFI